MSATDFRFWTWTWTWTWTWNRTLSGNVTLTWSTSQMTWKILNWTVKKCGLCSSTGYGIWMVLCFSSPAPSGVLLSSSL